MEANKGVITRRVAVSAELQALSASELRKVLVAKPVAQSFEEALEATFRQYGKTMERLAE